MATSTICNQNSVRICRAGHSLIFSRFAIRSPLNFFTWIADAHAFIFLISLFARRSNARRSTSGSLSVKGLNHSSLLASSMKFSPLPFFYNHLACQDSIPSLDKGEPVLLKKFFAYKILIHWYLYSSRLMYFIQHCFICRPSDSTVSEDAVIEPGTVATSERNNTPI